MLPKGDQWEEDGKVPREVLRQMGSLGMLGLRVPEEHGGLGLGMLASATFAEALGASTFGGFDVTVLVHTDMAGPHLVNSGTPEQLEHWMPGVLAGETILSIGVTEPDAGSDVAGIRTNAVKDGDGWRINGTKTFITNAVYGDMTIIAAKTDPDNRYGITMFLVPAGTEGFTVAKKLDKHGWRCSRHGRVGARRRVGPRPPGARHRASRLLRDDEELPERAHGHHRRGLRRGPGRDRPDPRPHPVAPGVRKSLYDLGAVRQRMAMNQAKLDAVRAALYHAAWLGDDVMGPGADNVKEMSGVKAFGAEAVNQIMYDCVQFHGGMGYMRETPVERMYRDARINAIGGGATEVMLEEIAKRSYLA